MLSHKIGLIIAAVMVSSIAVADSFRVDWIIKANQPLPASEYEFTYREDGIICRVDKLEHLIPAGEKRHVVCMAGKETIAARDVLCNKQQVESFIDTGILYVECKTR